MAYEPKELSHVNIAGRSSLFIKDNIKFYNTWPKMEASINFLLRWRGILEDPKKDWLSNFLQAFEAYIEPNINFDDLGKLEFILPNFIKSNRELTTSVFPPGSTMDDVEDIVMFCWKKEEMAQC